MRLVVSGHTGEVWVWPGRHGDNVRVSLPHSLSFKWKLAPG